MSELSIARIVQVTKFEIDFALSEEVGRKCLRYHNSTFSLYFQISIDCLHAFLHGYSSIFIDIRFLQSYALVELCRNLTRIAFLRI